jgi:hypothetical protein
LKFNNIKMLDASLPTIKESTLRELVEAASIKSACAMGTRGGYAIVIRCGTNERALASVRGDVRLFTLDHATKFLRSIGLSRFEVDATNYEEARMRKARPDRAMALKLTVTKPRQQALI